MSTQFYHQKETGQALLDLIVRNEDTRTSFCKKAGISRSTLEKLLRGEFKDEIRYDICLRKVGKVYGVIPEPAEYNSQRGEKPFSGLYLNPGNQDFAEICGKNYVDKTGMISLMNERIGTGGKLVCVSRPRRFGKSYAAKMLCAYYDRSCDSSELFRGREIEKDADYSKWLNSLNVISLDITGFVSSAKATGKSAASVVQDIREKVRGDVLSAYPEAEGDSTGELLAKIAKRTGERFFFIIDEWDALFRDAAADSKVRDEYMNFLRELFKNGNVTSQAVAGAYMTGILPIKKDESESAVSDFEEYTMLQPGPFAPYFGFTENEVHTLCDINEMSFGEAKRWYDGYTIGDKEALYNPYSVMTAIRNRRFGSYWRQSSAADILADYIGMNFDGLTDAVVSLLAGIAVPVNTGGFDNDLTSMKNRDDVLTLLIHLGYLTYDEENGTVHIPNEELRIEFSRSVREVKSTETIERVRESEQLIKDTTEGREEAVASEIEKIHREETTPLFYNNEQALRSVVKLAYFAYRDYYISMEELPSGTGYVDIAYLPKRGVSLPALVVELKWNHSAETAIEQIKKKHYPDVLRHYTSDILLVGISYNRKDPEKKHSCRIEVYSEEEKQ